MEKTHLPAEPRYLSKTMLPKWMFYGWIAFILLIGLAFFWALTNDSTDAPVDSDPYATVPQDQLSN